MAGGKEREGIGGVGLNVGEGGDGGKRRGRIEWRVGEMEC